MSQTDAVLPEIEAYLRRHKMTATHFGRVTMRDPRLVHDLRQNRRTLRASTVTRLRNHMAGLNPTPDELQRRDAIHLANRMADSLAAGNLMAAQEEHYQLGRALKKMGYGE